MLSIYSYFLQYEYVMKAYIDLRHLAHNFNELMPALIILIYHVAKNMSSCNSNEHVLSYIT
jgi:hypothetical protein